MAAAVAAAIVTAGCGSGQVSAARSMSPTSRPTASAVGSPGGPGPADHRGGGRPGGGRPAGAPSLPTDFPRDVPVPPGTLLGSSGSAGQWSLLLLARGSASQVLDSTTAFYRGAGFTSQGSGILHRGRYRITVVAENRDHSNSETNLAVGVSVP